MFRFFRLTCCLARKFLSWTFLKAFLSSPSCCPWRLSLPQRSYRSLSPQCSEKLVVFTDRFCRAVELKETKPPKVLDFYFRNRFAEPIVQVCLLPKPKSLIYLLYYFGYHFCSKSSWFQVISGIVPNHPIISSLIWTNVGRRNLFLEFRITRWYSLTRASSA